MAQDVGSGARGHPRLTFQPSIQLIISLSRSRSLSLSLALALALALVYKVGGFRGKYMYFVQQQLSAFFVFVKSAGKYVYFEHMGL